jgi:hypothetical protein
VKTSVILRFLCALESFLGGFGRGRGLSFQDELKVTAFSAAL